VPPSLLRIGERLGAAERCRFARAVNHTVQVQTELFAFPFFETFLRAFSVGSFLFLAIMHWFNSLPHWLSMGLYTKGFHGDTRCVHGMVCPPTLFRELCRIWWH
jgi:hypothetical protein